MTERIIQLTTNYSTSSDYISMFIVISASQQVKNSHIQLVSLQTISYC